MMRRCLIPLAFAFTASNAAYAAKFPDKAITLTVPYTAGGVTDLVARSLGKTLESDLGVPVVIENKPGANGTLGAVKMTTVKPTGYELSIVPVGIFRQPVIQKMSFDPVKDLTYIASLVDYTYVIAVRADSKWKTINEFIEDAKRDPGKTYGTPGVYSTPHLSMESLAQVGGFEFTHVPYKGAAEIVPALMGGQIDIVAGTGSSALNAYVERGDIRILASISDERLTDFPDVPTLKESGLDIVAKAPFGVVGPTGMDPEVVQKLDDAIKRALHSAEFANMAQQNGVVVKYMGADDYSQYAKETAELERERMTRLVEQAKK